MLEIFTNPSAWHWTAYLLLIPLVLCSVFVAKYSKEHKANPFWGLPTLASVVGFQYYFWQTTHKPWDYFFYALGCFVSLVFLLGVSICTTNCLTSCDGELCINRSSLGYNLLSKLPMQMEGKSLCQISWLGAILILFWPIIVLLLGVICMIASLVFAFFTGQNPFDLVKTMLKLESFPCLELQKRGFWPLAPVFYVVPAVLLYFAVINLTALLVGAWHLLLLVLSFVLVVVVFASIVCGITYGLYKLLGLENPVQAEAKNRAEQNLIEERNYVANPTAFGDYFSMYGYFWQVFKHKFCPKIRYIDGTSGYDPKTTYRDRY